MLPVAEHSACSRVNGRLVTVDERSMVCAGGQGKGGCQVNKPKIGPCQNLFPLLSISDLNLLSKLNDVMLEYGSSVMKSFFFLSFSGGGGGGDFPPLSVSFVFNSSILFASSNITTIATTKQARGEICTM